MTGVQLVKKFSAFYGNRRFVTAYKSPSLVCILRSSLHTHTHTHTHTLSLSHSLSFFKLYFSIILTAASSYAKRSLPFKFSCQILHVFLSSLTFYTLCALNPSCFKFAIKIQKYICHLNYEAEVRICHSHSYQVCKFVCQFEVFFLLLSTFHWPCVPLLQITKRLLTDLYNYI